MESYPAYVSAIQVLSREDPDTIEVLIDQLQHLVIKAGHRLGAGDLLLGTGHASPPGRLSWLLPHLNLLPSPGLFLFPEIKV